MALDWYFKTDEYICDVRTAGVLISNGKILLQRERGGLEYAVPGGHVKIGETTEAALIREYQEETGAEIHIDRLLWTEECLWEWNGTPAHNFCFYYAITNAGDLMPPEVGEFFSQKDNGDIVFVWVSLKELENLTVYPSFLKEMIHHPKAAPRHFVTRA